MPERNFKIGIVQMSCTPEPEQNLERAIAHVRAAAGQRRRDHLPARALSDAVFLPARRHRTLRSRGVDSRTGDQAPWRCRTRVEGDHHRVAVRATRRRAFITTRQPSSTTGGKLAGIYRKMHIPDDPLYYEKFYFTPGDLGFKAFETDFGKFGTLVCWDQWYPEGARLTALQGANVLFYPTAIGWHPDEKGRVRRGAVRCVAYNSARTCDCQRRVRGGAESRRLRDRQHSRQRSAAGQRPGVLGRIVYRRSIWAGDCAGFARQGRDAGGRGRHLRRMEDVRRNWPFWRDRRVDAYAPITQRFMV